MTSGDARTTPGLHRVPSVIVGEGGDMDPAHLEFFECRMIPEEDVAERPKSGRPNIVDDLGQEVVDFIECYVRSKGQVATSDPCRLACTGKALGAPARHIAQALALHHPNLAASKDAIRKIFVGPRQDSVGYLGLVNAKMARHNRKIGKPHVRGIHCAVGARMAEEFTSYLHHQGWPVAWFASDDKAKLPLWIPCLTYQKPSGSQSMGNSHTRLPSRVSNALGSEWLVNKQVLAAHSRLE